MYHVCQHPLIKIKLPLMRDENCSMAAFRDYLQEITYLLAAESLSQIPLQELPTPVQSPTGASANAFTLARPVVFIPILRAGLGMIEPFMHLLPDAQVGYLAMSRDERTLKAENYYVALPKVDNPITFIIDPMLATGGSIIEAIKELKTQGYKDIRVVSLVAAMEGINAIEKVFPSTDILVAALDDHLNEKGYIIPGLGDAGDRLFGGK